MHKDFQTHAENRSFFRTVLNAYKPHLCVMLWVACIWSLEVSAKPYLIKMIVDGLEKVGQGSIYNAIAKPMFLFLSLNLTMSLSFRVYEYFVQIRMVPSLRKTIATKASNMLLDKSHNFFQNSLSGSLANRVNDLTDAIPEILHIVIDRFFSHGLGLLVAVATLWLINIRFALFMGIWIFAFITIAYIFSKHLTLQASKYAESGSRIMGRLVDVFSNILTVRLFAGKSSEKQGFQQVFDEAVQTERRLQWTYFWLWLILGVSFFTLQCVNFYFLIHGHQAGWVTLGDFAAVLVINMSIVDMIWTVAYDFSQFSKLTGKYKQSVQAISVPDISIDTPDATPLSVTKGHIVFENVQFKYPQAEPLFDKKSIIINAGQKVGLVGYSGSGKTSFVNLILRIFDVTKGRILIDDQDIRQKTLDSLRENIGMIPQDPTLFHRSLMDNIRYGSPRASNEDVIKASKKAMAHDFIKKLEQEYDSMVGERGIKLSGGQRQRIAIARAFLKNAPILILDEATSQLDSLTETEIQETLWTLMENKTTLVIAHRLSTLMRMDRILVFNKGKIVEDGSHEELLAQGGLYKTLWDTQVGGFLPEN